MFSDLSSIFIVGLGLSAGVIVLALFTGGRWQYRLAKRLQGEHEDVDITREEARV